MKNSAEIFKEIRNHYTREKAISELKKLINFYNKASPSILARFIFLDKINLNGKGIEKTTFFQIGIVKNLSLSLNEHRLRIKLLLSLRDRKFKTNFEREINLEDMIQIIPLKTAPRNNPFSKKAKVITEEDIRNQIKEEGEKNGK